CVETPCGLARYLHARRGQCADGSGEIRPFLGIRIPSEQQCPRVGVLDDGEEAVVVGKLIVRIEPDFDTMRTGVQMHVLEYDTSTFGLRLCGRVVRRVGLRARADSSAAFAADGELGRALGCRGGERHRTPRALFAIDQHDDGAYLRLARGADDVDFERARVAFA